MILFTINQKEDVEYLLHGIDDGAVGEERIEEAATRILALKASLKLHEKSMSARLVPEEGALAVLKCEEHVRWARDCADNSVTLVKDEEGLLPLSSKIFKRVLLCVVTNEPRDEAGHTPESLRFRRKLELEGFAVDDFDMSLMPGASSDTAASIAGLKSKYDLIVYYANMRVASNQNSVRTEWSNFLAGDAPKYVKDVPTVFISASNPYHLLDVPMIGTYINAYSSNEYVVDALVEKLMGRSAFLGKSPVDAFCGLWDTHVF
jgi:beta-N-acetylhexosaminidase